jgi:succinate dehydrogenase flavin-adding protein (antitoxin of CptAB toxin-antitoxin module)
VRGIERRNIFRNNTDRLDFVERFSNLLNQTDTDCFAWALIKNHSISRYVPTLVN